MTRLSLPWPPSVNHYWLARKGSHGKRLSAEALGFRRAAARAWRDLDRIHFGPAAQLHVVVGLWPPDHRRRDVDNFGGKAILDALQCAGVYADDSQVKHLEVVMYAPEKPGRCVVEIEEIRA